MSIKKKLVTAVTTAGLLAGLFGSAFVPSAYAAAPTVAVTATGNDGADATAKTYYFLSSVNPVIVITATDTAGNDDGTYDVSVTGTTVLSCVESGDSTLATTVIGTGSCAVTTASTTGQTTVITLTLKKMAAGVSATISLTGPSDADNSTALTLDYTTVSSVASTAGSTVADATQSAKAFKMNSDGDGTKGATTDVADEVIGGVDYFLPTVALNQPVYAGLVSNGYGTTTGNISVIAEVSNDDFTVGCDATVSGAATSSGAAIQIITATAGVFECEVHSDGADSAGGAWTLTVRTTLTGTVVGTASGAFYGEVASITASLVAGDRVPETPAAEVDDFIKLVVKDAAGKAYGLAETNALTITGYGTVAGGTTAGAQDMTDGTSAATKNHFKVDVDFCPASSTGKTASVQAANANATGTSIKSNALTITCAADKDDAITIQKIEFEKSNPLPGETFDIHVYMEDADGVLAGAGDVAAADFVLNLTGATETGSTWDGTTVTASTSKVNSYGYIVFELKAPSTIGTAITVNDPTSSVIAKVFTTNDAYAGVLTVGPKKLKATADFGPAAASKKVAFVLESASGTTKTYYRKANASGVASYTLGLRGTWTVYATFGDEISDTGTMKK
jgi:hypothetical protein